MLQHVYDIYLVVDSTALLDDVAQASAGPCAAIPARHWPDLLDRDRVVAELGRAHERGGRSLDDRKDSTVNRLITRGTHRVVEVGSGRAGGVNHKGIRWPYLIRCPLLLKAMPRGVNGWV